MRKNLWKIQLCLCVNACLLRVLHSSAAFAIIWTKELCYHVNYQHLTHDHLLLIDQKSSGKWDWDSSCIIIVKLSQQFIESSLGTLNIPKFYLLELHSWSESPQVNWILVFWYHTPQLKCPSPEFLSERLTWFYSTQESALKEQQHNCGIG